MAIYHLSISIVSRGKGKSAVAAAAYRAAELIKNEYDGIIHDYTRKGGVVHTGVLLPAQAPGEFSNRALLWNAVEKTEKAENAQLAREVEFSLPLELTREQNISLAHDFVQRTFVSAGMCADICIHEKDGGKLHAHVLLTMRPINDNGAWGGKQKKEYILDRDGNKIYDPKKRQYKCRSIPSTDWNDRGNTEIWRAAWEEHANAALQKHGSEARIDHRSYERQGVEIIPSIKLGVAAHQMEKRGIRTERGDINREIEITNNQIRQLRARMNKLAVWLKEEEANTKPPTLADVLDEIFTRKGQSAMTHIRNGMEVFNFLYSNDIREFADLNNRVNEMNRNLTATSDELKKVERRIKTLKEHLYQSGFHKEHRPLKRQYDRLYSKYEAAKKETGLFAERKEKKALDAASGFFEANRAELTLFIAAEKYLREHMGKHFDPKKLPPIKEWEKELAEKTAVKDELYVDYYKLKDDITKIEKIQRSVKEILHNDEPQPERTTTRKRAIEI